MERRCAGGGRGGAYRGGGVTIHAIGDAGALCRTVLSMVAPFHACLRFAGVNGGALPCRVPALMLVYDAIGAIGVYSR
jgi:hypothetical protein